MSKYSKQEWGINGLVLKLKMGSSNPITHG